MKKIIILAFFLLPGYLCAQVKINSIRHFSIRGGIPSPVGIPVDTSYETKTATNFLLINYNPLRPFSQVTTGSEITIAIDSLQTSGTGHLRVFLNAGGTLHLSGIVNATIPSAPATIILIYTPVAGIINWN